LGLNVVGHLAEGGNWLFCVLGAAGSPLVNLAASKLRPQETLRRGAAVATVSEVNRVTAKLPRADFDKHLEMGGSKLPRRVEPYHLFVVGSTGSGKSVAITNLLDELEARGDLALIVDSGGEFCSRYLKPGRDHVLNPFDDRCVPWSPTSEMAGPWDAEALAKSIIPDGVGESKEWNSYAQVFVTSILRRLSEENSLNIERLLYYVQSAGLEELNTFLAGTAASAQLVSEKTFGSIRTIASAYMATYDYLGASDDPFSVSKFIRAEKPGFLFLTYRDDQLDSLRNMISCVLDVAARTILALPANSERRVWLIIDEFASIGKVQSIEDVATKARKMGGCLLLGLQSVSQLQDRYGDKAAQTILSCLSSWLILRCTDADTAEYISKYIGDAEVSRMMAGESSSDSGGSDSLNQQIQTQRAVLPIQIQQLKNLEGFFKLAGQYPVAKMKLDLPEKRNKVGPNYADRDFIAKPMLSSLQKQKKAADQESGGLQQAQAAQPLSLRGVEPVSEAPNPAPAQPTPAAKPRIAKRRKNALEQGPAALEKKLLELARAYEDG